jgi:hypothetical protein
LLLSDETAGGGPSFLPWCIVMLLTISVWIDLRVSGVRMRPALEH